VRGTAGPRLHVCERCGGKYILVATQAGSWQRLSPTPSMTEGTVILVDAFPGCSPRDRVACTLTKEQLASGRRWWRYTDHRASCTHPQPSSTLPSFPGAA